MAHPTFSDIPESRMSHPTFIDIVGATLALKVGGAILLFRWSYAFGEECIPDVGSLVLRCCVVLLSGAALLSLPKACDRSMKCITPLQSRMQHPTFSDTADTAPHSWQNAYDHRCYWK
jgi:hypothetical protein